MRARRVLRAELLEERRVLSTILWTNRNDGTNLSNFSAAFGSQENAAMRVVDAAIDAWEQVIGEFNWPDNPDDHTFEVEINVDPNNSGCGGAADTGADDDGVPQDGSFTFNACGGPSNIGWYLDPTPFDSAEFRGEITNAFALDATPNGPAAGVFDLFTVIVSEMAHLVGIAQDEDFLLEDLNDNNPPFVDWGIDDAAFDTGTLWTYTGSVPALFTDNNGGNGGDNTGEPLHIAEPVLGNRINFGGTTYYGAQDAGNAVYEMGRRYLPSRLLAVILDDVYPYDINPPQSFGTAYANLDPTTGNLLIRGGSSGGNVYFPTSPSDDTFTLSREGNRLRVDVSIGIPVPGTATDGTLTSYFDMSDIQTISIQTSTDPNVVIDGTGEETVILDFGGGTIIPSGGIVVDGGANTNYLQIRGSAVPQNYLVDSTQITVGGRTITYDNFQDVQIVADATTSNNTFRVNGTPSDLTNLLFFGSTGDDIFDIEGLNANTTVDVAALDGADQIYLGLVSSDLDDVEGTVLVNGGIQAMADMFVRDSSDSSDNTYLISANSPTEGLIQRNTSLQILYNSLNSVEVRGARGGDLFDVRGTIPGTPVNLHGEFGDDRVVIDSNGSGPGGMVDGVDSLVTIDGGVGSNTVVLNDVSDATADTVTITADRVGAGQSDNFFGATGSLRYEDIDDLTLNMGRPGDSIRIHATAPGTTTTVNGGLGNNNFNVFLPDELKHFGNVEGIVSHLILNGFKGFNTVWILDSTDTTADQITITDTEVGAAPGDNLFGPGGRLTYSQIDRLRIDGGSPNGATGNTFFVKSTFPETVTTINAGKQDDTLLVDSNGSVPFGTLNDIHSRLVFNGGGGADAATLGDTGEFFANQVTVTAMEVGAAPGDNFFGTGGSLGYSGLSSLTLLAGGGADTIQVEGTATGAETAIRGGDGSDTFNVDSNSTAVGGTANMILSRLEIVGENGNDALTISDTDDVAPNVASITPTDVGAASGDNLFGAGGSLGYADLTDLRLLTGAGSDSITVNGTSAGTPVTVDSGDGADVLAVKAPISSPIRYEGGNPSASPGDSLQLIGNGATKGTYLPDGTMSGKGKVILDGSQTVSFTRLEPVTASGFAFFTLETPNNADQLFFNALGTSRHQFTGTSDGVAIEPLTIFDIDTMFVDMGSADTGPGLDQLTVQAGDLTATGVNLLAVDGGIGTNRIQTNSGRINLDLSPGGTGTDLVQVAGVGTTVNFVTTQHLTLLQIDSGAFVNIDANGGYVLETNLLSITGGSSPSGTLNLNDNAAIVNYADGGSSPFLLHQDQIDHAREQNLPVLWTGTGITSTQAALDTDIFDVTIVEASDLLGPSGGTYLGVSLPPGDDAVLIRAWSSVPGDMDGNGVVDFDDIAGFSQALGDPDSYIATHGVPPAKNGDIDGNGDLDFDDIPGFTTILAGPVTATGEADGLPSAEVVATVFSAGNRPGWLLPAIGHASIDGQHKHAGETDENRNKTDRIGRHMPTHVAGRQHRRQSRAHRVLQVHRAKRSQLGEPELASIWSPDHNWLRFRHAG